MLPCPTCGRSHASGGMVVACRQGRMLPTCGIMWACVGDVGPCGMAVNPKAHRPVVWNSHQHLAIKSLGDTLTNKQPQVRLCTRCGINTLPPKARRFCLPCKAIRKRETASEAKRAYKAKQDPPAHTRQPLPTLTLTCIRCSNTFEAKRGTKLCNTCLVMK